MQLWLELGVPGAVVFALLVTLAWFALSNVDWPRLFTTAAGMSLAVALLASCASYGIWEEWWLDTLWFSLFAIIVMGRVARSAAVMPAGNIQPQTFPDRLD